MLPGTSFQMAQLKRTYIQEEYIAQRRGRMGAAFLGAMECILRGSPGRGSHLCSWWQIEIIKGLVVWFILGNEFNVVTLKNQLSNFRCQKWTHRPWKWEFVLRLYGQTRRRDSFLFLSLNWGWSCSRGRGCCDRGLTAGRPFPSEAYEARSYCLGARLERGNRPFSGWLCISLLSQPSFGPWAQTPPPPHLAGKGPRPPLGAGNQPHPGTGSERPVWGSALRLLCPGPESGLCQAHHQT